MSERAQLNNYHMTSIGGNLSNGSFEYCNDAVFVAGKRKIFGCAV